MTKAKRTSSGLRDILFDEIEALRSPDGNPSRALAVAKLAQQIMGTVRVEMEFHKLAENTVGASPSALKIGGLNLGSAVGAEKNATGH